MKGHNMYVLKGPDGYRREFSEIPSAAELEAQVVECTITVADFKRVAKPGSYLSWIEHGCWKLENVELGELMGYAPKRFPLAKYATVADLFEAKATYFETHLRTALCLLDDMVAFAQAPEIQAATDGANDPAVRLEQIAALFAEFGLVVPGNAETAAAV